MAARTDQMDEVAAAASWLETNQAQVLPLGFNLQRVTVMLAEDPATGVSASIEFTWSDDHYNFTVA